jgi:hypothetical protein
LPPGLRFEGSEPRVVSSTDVGWARPTKRRGDPLGRPFAFILSGTGFQPVDLKPHRLKTCATNTHTLSGAGLKPASTLHITLGPTGAVGAPGTSWLGTGATGEAASGGAGVGAGGAGDTPSDVPAGGPSPGGVAAGGIGAIPPGGPAGGPPGPVPAVLNRDGSISENQAGTLATDFQGPLGLRPR